MRRVVRAGCATGVVLAVMAAPALAPTALAHNGVGAAFKGRAGGYIVYAYDGFVSRPGVLTYRLILLDARDKEPVYGVHVAVTSSRLPDDPARLPATATGSVTTYGNVFFYDLPNPFPGHWQVRLRLHGRLGAASVAYRMHGAQPAAVTTSDSGGSFPWLAAAIAGLAVIVLAAAAAAVRRRVSSRTAAT